MSTLFWTASCPRLRDDDDAHQAELDWASNRPGSLWSTHAGDNAKPIAGTMVGELTPHEACLTDCETRFFDGYKEKFPDSVYSLNQDPTVKPMYAHGKAH